MARHGSKPARIGDVLKGVLEARGMGGSAGMATLLAGWEGAVGKAVAGHARPEMLRGRLLTVLVDNSVWMNQLAMLRPEITEKVNALLGGEGVEEIRFRIGKAGGGETSSRKAAPYKPKRRALMPEEVAAVEESLQPINDPELKERARRLFTTACSVKA